MAVGAVAVLTATLVLASFGLHPANGKPAHRSRCSLRTASVFYRPGTDQKVMFLPLIPPGSIAATRLKRQAIVSTQWSGNDGRFVARPGMSSRRKERTSSFHFGECVCVCVWAGVLLWLLFPSDVK